MSEYNTESGLIKIKCPDPKCGKDFHIRLGITEEEQKAYDQARVGEKTAELRVCPLCEAQVVIQRQKREKQAGGEALQRGGFRGGPPDTLPGRPPISALARYRCPNCDYQEDVIAYSSLNPPRCRTPECNGCILIIARESIAREPLESSKGGTAE